MRKFDLEDMVTETHAELVNALSELPDDLTDLIMDNLEDNLWELAQSRVNSSMDDYWDMRFEEERDRRLGL